MRQRLPLILGFLSACSSTLYSRYAGPVTADPDGVYSCVVGQLKTMGYVRTQFDSSAHWFIAQKTVGNQIASGTYRHTLEVLDTKVTVSNEGQATLDITARTFDKYATARGDTQEERKASDRVQFDARTLGQACGK